MILAIMIRDIDIVVMPISRNGKTYGSREYNDTLLALEACNDNVSVTVNYYEQMYCNRYMLQRTNLLNDLFYRDTNEFSFSSE